MFTKVSFLGVLCCFSLTVWAEGADTILPDSAAGQPVDLAHEAAVFRGRGQAPMSVLPPEIAQGVLPAGRINQPAQPSGRLLNPTSPAPKPSQGASYFAGTQMNHAVSGNYLNTGNSINSGNTVILK